MDRRRVSEKKKKKHGQDDQDDKKGFREGKEFLIVDYFLQTEKKADRISFFFFVSFAKKTRSPWVVYTMYMLPWRNGFGMQWTGGGERIVWGWEQAERWSTILILCFADKLQITYCGEWDRSRSHDHVTKKHPTSPPPKLWDIVIGNLQRRTWAMARSPSALVVWLAEHSYLQVGIVSFITLSPADSNVRSNTFEVWVTSWMYFGGLSNLHAERNTMESETYKEK